MKRKYQGMLTMGLTALALLLSGVYYRTGTWQTTSLGMGRVPPTGTRTWTPTALQMGSIQKLADELPALAFPVSQRKDRLPLRLFGELSPEGGRGEIAGRTQAANYGLSLTVLAGPVRFCVIDGSLLAEGERLSDGARVVRIAHQKVLIATEGARKWLSLDDTPAAAPKTFYSHAGPEKGPS